MCEEDHSLFLFDEWRLQIKKKKKRVNNKQNYTKQVREKKFKPWNSCNLQVQRRHENAQYTQNLLYIKVNEIFNQFIG